MAHRLRNAALPFGFQHNLGASPVAMPQWQEAGVFTNMETWTEIRRHVDAIRGLKSEPGERRANYPVALGSS